jgi:serralysin
MIGGQGNDTYYVDNIYARVSDSVTTYTEVPGALLGLPTQNNAGIDTVYADLASYTLGSFIEELKASRANPFAGTGNALDNWIQGHNAADTLKGPRWQ